MREIKTLLGISLVLGLMSCENENNTYNNYQSGLGYVDTSIISNYEYGIQLDQDISSTLIPIMIDDDYYTVKHGDRVFVSYSLLETSEIDSPDAEVLLRTITPITLKDVIPYDTEEANNYGNEPSYLENKSLWQTDQILNAHIGYMGTGFGNHTVVLTVSEDLDQDENGNYILDI